MRIVHTLVICALILAASVVYKIKFDSTLQAERVAKLQGELRKERNAVAALRADWARLETPARIKALADRHLKLTQIAPIQIDSLDRLPEKPPTFVQPKSSDPIGAMIAPLMLDQTGSIAVPKVR